ncbi:MAG: hypothetical protein JW709_01330 [Sedimentisphaerales bacterium]|nr:hypothetical protein [Sedimentisphaerales bacterium]
MSIGSRERLLLTLSGRLPDRVPVSPFVQDEYLSYYYPQKSSVDRVYDTLELAQSLDFDLIAKPKNFVFPHFLRKSFPNWLLEEDRYTRDGKVYVRRTIETPKKTLTQVQVGPDVGVAGSGTHLSTHEYFLKTHEDIEIFLEFLPAIDAESIAEMRTVAAQWRQALGEHGVAAPWGWCGVYNMASEYRNIEALMMDAFDAPELYQALMGTLSAQMVIYNTHLAQTEVECVGVSGNIANSALFGSDFFAQHIEPFEKPIIDAIHAQDTFTIYHNCGCAKNLYPNYRRMAFTLWETVSEAPAGDNDLRDAKAYFGESMCLLGNLDQIHFLKTATPDEVAQKTRALVEIGKPGGRYIFSCSDFLEKGTPLANVKAMLKAARETGQY